MSNLNPLSSKTEAHIRAWTAEIADSQSIGPDSLQELESHLIDSIHELKRKGLSEEEAFLIATTRTGSANELAVEYAKSGESYRWANRVFWMCIGYLAISLSLRLALTLSAVASTAVAYSVGEFSAFMMLGSWAVCLIGFLGICFGLWSLSQRTSGLRRRISNGQFLAIVVLVPLFSFAVTTGCQIWLTRLVSPATFGQIAVTSSSIASFAVPLLVPLAIAFIAILLRNRTTRSSEIVA